MNKHFTKDYDIFTDTEEHIADNPGGKPWDGIILSNDSFEVSEITIEDRTKLTSGTTPTAAEYLEGAQVGIPFLCKVTQIKASAGAYKMLKPN